MIDFMLDVKRSLLVVTVGAVKDLIGILDLDTPRLQIEYLIWDK